MIKLSTMQTVVATVNDHWESDLAEELLSHWEHDAARAKYWRASANFIFFFKHLGREYILRFNHASERTSDAIQAEIDFIKTLASTGVRVAMPIPSRAGNDVESVVTALGIFHTVVFEKLPGKHLDVEELTPNQFLGWGKALGELHNVAAHYSNAGRPTWEDHLTFVAETLPTDDYLARQALGKLKKQLDQLPINPQNFGLIHYDFELDNILWDGDQPGIIDFDDAAWYWFVADIAFALRDLFSDRADNVNLQDASLQDFIRGYASVRPVHQEELALIPLFLRMHNLVMYAKLLRAMTPPNPTGEAALLAELRGKLTAKVQFYRAELSA